MVKEKFDLTGKVALVIGGRGVLGRSFCAAFAEHGARVYAADLDKEGKTPTRGEQPAGATQLVVDVTDPESVNALVQQVSSESPSIDILVYSVTAKPKDFYVPFTECSLEGWQFVLRTELDGLFLVTQKVGAIMEKAGRGSMVFLSSIYGMVGNDQRIYEGSNLNEVYLSDKPSGAKQIFSHPVYAAAKGGVISLTRYLAAYWGKQNIRVNCISPGGLYNPGENAEFVKRYSDRVPMGRKASIDEVSGAALFLASDASSYVTGHNLVVDGGWTAW